jgi:hypothetical protein
MSTDDLFIPLCFTSLVWALSTSATLAAGTEAQSGSQNHDVAAAGKAPESAARLPLSIEEIAARRKAVREELMVPSLAGIRGIAYRVVGFKDFQPLEKIMAARLEHLSIKKIQLMKADGQYKDCDAVVQITFSRAGAHTIAELKVTQFASLLRNPKIVVKAVTYSDKVYSLGHKPEESVEKLCDEFVVDFLKANQKGFDAEKSSKSAATTAEHPANKTGKK